MKWFEKTIPEAIAAAKRINGYFIVYLYDKSDASKEAREILDSDALSTALSSLKFVAINIENGSNEAIQFAQIYPLIVVPSLFFISGETGVPVEVIGGNFNEESLVEKIKKISSSTSKVPLNENSIEPSVEETVAVIENKPEPVSENTSVETPEINNTEGASAVTSLPSESAVDNISLEDKAERAQILIAQKRELKALEEIKEEKKKEIDRRRQSHEVAKAKQKQEEMERSNMMRQRRKDKEDDKLAREKVKAQIAADRAERLAREAILKGTYVLQNEPEPSTSSSTTSPQRKNDITRIKFRFPDNSSDLAQFPSTATLQVVRDYLRQSSLCLFRNFNIVSTLPHQTFTQEHNSSTLEELGLSPSSIIIVKPIATPSGGTLVPSSQGFMDIFWSLLAPFTFLLNYLKNILGLGATRRRSNSSELSDDEDGQAVKKSRTEGSYTTRNRPKTAYGNRQGSILRREGNIHRFNNAGDNDDEDENNTWNGNSTQQM